MAQKVLEQRRHGLLDALQFLNVTTFPTGVYELVVAIGGEKITQKIIVQ
jgi:hypothetical protein